MKRLALILITLLVLTLAGCECITYKPFQHPDTW